MGVLYGFWGFTTIFLFWGALIRATREWGGQSSQGAAFGIMESGRGLAAALLAALAVAVLAWYMPDDATLATDAERRAGLRTIILLYSAATFAAAAMAWLLIPDPGEATQKRAANPFAGMAIVVRRPIVWAQAAIIVCAYCAYKGLDNYSLYAVQVLGMDEVEGARLASYGAYVRPVAARYLLCSATGDANTSSFNRRSGRNDFTGWLHAGDFLCANRRTNSRRDARRRRPSQSIHVPCLYCGLRCRRGWVVALAQEVPK